MAYGRHAVFDTLRELAYSGISTNYAAVGGSLAYDARLVIAVNNTDKAIYFSVDGTNAVMRIPSGGIETLNLTTNKVDDQGFFLAVGTKFYAKQTADGAPASGSVSIQVIYATPSP